MSEKLKNRFKKDTSNEEVLKTITSKNIDSIVAIGVFFAVAAFSIDDQMNFWQGSIAFCAIFIGLYFLSEFCEEVFVHNKMSFSNIVFEIVLIWLFISLFAFLVDNLSLQFVIFFSIVGIVLFLIYSIKLFLKVRKFIKNKIITI